MQARPVGGAHLDVFGAQAELLRDGVADGVRIEEETFDATGQREGGHSEQGHQDDATGTRQHSITFNARPPRAVSLYFVFMSAPVSRMVLMTLSSDT